MNKHKGKEKQNGLDKKRIGVGSGKMRGSMESKINYENKNKSNFGKSKNRRDTKKNNSVKLDR